MKFIFSKLAVLQAYSQQLYYQNELLHVLKIHRLVGEGVKQVTEMPSHIRIFVKMELFRNQELPPTTSRRYFPKTSDLRNHTL